VGWAQILYHSYITGDGGTFNWAAPEQLIGLKCTAKADVYSYGLGECLAVASVGVVWCGGGG